MSIPVTLDRLDDELARFGHHAFVLTTSDDGRPHISHITLVHERGVLRGAAGQHTAANVARRPQIAVLWPPRDTEGFSLIVDADAVVEDAVLQLRVTKAILHRPPPE
jgi:hypothetical protein